MEEKMGADKKIGLDSKEILNETTEKMKFGYKGIQAEVPLTKPDQTTSNNIATMLVTAFVVVGSLCVGWFLHKEK